MQRDITPDVLRGFALLGILMVNIPFMALSSDEGARGEWAQGLANGSATWMMAAIFAGKFYLLFSFLFGYSSSYIIKNNRANRGRWIKRCFALMAFGAIHFTFLWHGDIIFLYGLLGLLLLAFMFRTDRVIKIWTRVIYSVSAVLITFIGLSVLIGERLFPEEFEDAYVEPMLDEVLRSGTFIDSISPRLELWAFGLISGVFLQGGMAFAAFLLGMRLARSNFLSGPFDELQNSRMIKRGLIFGLPIQMIAATILVRNEQSGDPYEGVYLSSIFLAFLSAPLLSMAYVGIIRKLAHTKPSAVSWMMPAGRMSLTVYISQSVITSLIFGPWGLGLFQELETWMVLILAVVIWLFLVYFSRIWLKRFAQGPLEKLMHALTSSKGTKAVEI
ncbi:MAG: DUF418 domain-containing protein [Candidatus Nanopelagicaceae bacterium]|nr:DUF418 domain-containing protein [Candidatus Nanopelagicaceae bacterium]